MAPARDAIEVPATPPAVKGCSSLETHFSAAFIPLGSGSPREGNCGVFSAKDPRGSDFPHTRFEIVVVEDHHGHQFSAAPFCMKKSADMEFSPPRRSGCGFAGINNLEVTGVLGNLTEYDRDRARNSVQLGLLYGCAAGKTDG